MRVSMLVAGAACVALYAFTVTQGTWQFFVQDSVSPMSRSFDALAESLVHNRADVPENDCTWECLNDHNGHRFLYWGPWPALLRIPTLAAPALRGCWSRLSCFLAALLAVGAWAVGSAVALRPCKEVLYSLTLLCVVGFALGTPLFFVLSSAQIYHEAILWGLAGSMWAVVATFALLNDRRDAWLLPLALGAGVAFLSRPTFGGPALALLAWVLLVRPYPLRWTAPAIAIGLGAVLTYGWYNLARFGDPIVFMRFDWHYQRPWEWGGVSNWHRLPDALWEYWVPHAANVTSRFPWVQEAEVVYPTAPKLFDGYVEWVTPLGLSMAWLVALALVGLTALRLRWLVPVGILGAQAASIGMFWMVTQRYATEFIPVCALLGLLGLGRLR